MLRGRRLLPSVGRCSGGSRRFSSCASEASLSLRHLAQQSSVRFKASDAAVTNVQVVPVLSSSDFALRVSSSTDAAIDLQSLFTIVQEAVDTDEGAESVKSLQITKNEGVAAVETNVQLLLPHTVDLDIAVVNGSVHLQDKIEGDVKVVVGRGDVHVDKVRGKNVSLKTNGGSLAIKSLVEGETVRLEAADSVKCKRLMAGKAEVKLGKGSPSSESEFGAIYASTCNIQSTTQSGEAQLRLGNVHGYLRVASEGLKSVHVDSVTGALDLADSGAKCAVVAHFDSWTDDAASSILVGGDVKVSLQPAASIGVELHGTRVAIGDGCQFDSSEMDQLDEDYAVFTGELRAQEGTMTSASGSSGKINLGSAKDDAMRTSFFMRGSGSDKDNDEEGSRTPRLFVHALSGEVTLDQLDWMANIKRKHLNH
ncbi:hypothetical protein PHYBOEH_003704 [Phytophthora boehmeriae]|uniref:DUF4097 domain-containing protein n=1 Tax=Phytophthora boehmeriae TaxID=109152 RepID=A0A8T1WS91_9STRA|nr:hypothetical protein PHYBOEH_003704 [Phytophthora boehmeriae]